MVVTVRLSTARPGWSPRNCPGTRDILCTSPPHGWTRKGWIKINQRMVGEPGDRWRNHGYEALQHCPCNVIDKVSRVVRGVPYFDGEFVPQGGICCWCGAEPTLHVEVVS